MNINEDTIDALASAQEYLARGGDPDAYPDQMRMRRVLPWFLPHREPGHRCDVCVTPGPVSAISFCRKSRALSHLLNGGDRVAFADQDALVSVLPIYERSLPTLPLFEETI
jgi:hypothetical protein